VEGRQLVRLLFDAATAAPFLEAFAAIEDALQV